MIGHQKESAGLRGSSINLTSDILYWVGVIVHDPESNFSMYSIVDQTIPHTEEHTKTAHGSHHQALHVIGYSYLC